jgi:hypothetical protein
MAAAEVAHGDRAVAVAVERARDSLNSRASLVLIFPSGLSPDAVARDVAGLDPSIPVAGMSGGGSISREGALEGGCVALALDESISASISVAEGAGEDLRAAAARTAGEALGAIEGGDGEPMLLLFLDTRSGDQSDAVGGAYRVAGGAVPIAGGAAGGPEPFQLAGGAVLSDSVVAIGLRSPAGIAIGEAHGCHAIGPPSIATRSDGRRLLELDGRPATTVYLESMGFEPSGLSDSEFEALAVTHPLAQPEPHGSKRIRHVLGRDGDALLCATHIPADAAVEFTYESPDEIIAASSRAVAAAVDRLHGRPARAAIIFDCGGRKRAIGDALPLEVSALLDAFPGGPPPLAGLYTHGEVARHRGAKGDRNHAVVVVAFA